MDGDILPLDTHASYDVAQFSVGPDLDTMLNISFKCSSLN
jgi:hypothetical protein